MDIPVLKYLDVFIGLALVMVLGCSVVAAVTHVITAMFYLRAQYLRQGLSDLILRLDPEAPDEDRQYIAQLIQRHPSVARPATSFGQITSWLRGLFGEKVKMKWLPSGAPAVVVQRHEFVRILLEWGAGEGPLAENAELGKYSERIRRALQRCGVMAPLETLRALRSQTVAQERAYPERAAHLWNTAAAIDACPPDFIGQIHTWYDNMTTRTGQRFGLQAKMLGSLVALGVAALLPLDSLDLIKRLSVDDKLRKNLVQRAEAYQTEKEKLESQKTATPDSKVAEKQTLDDRLKKLDAGLDQTNARIDEFREGTLGITTPLDTPGGPAKKPNLEWYTKHVPGLLLSWVLLSLGAPFWYDALKDSLKLRSVLAAKDDKDKDERQRSDPNLGPAATNPALAGQAAAGVIAVSALPVREDESGDPDNAVG